MGKVKELPCKYDIYIAAITYMLAGSVPQITLMEPPHVVMFTFLFRVYYYIPITWLAHNEHVIDKYVMLSCVYQFLVLVAITWSWIIIYVKIDVKINSYQLTLSPLQLLHLVPWSLWNNMVDSVKGNVPVDKDNKVLKEEDNDPHESHPASLAGDDHTMDDDDHDITIRWLRGTSYNQSK